MWLYCDASQISDLITVTWNKDGRSLVQNVPHIRLRTLTSSTSTTLLLVIDNAVSSDAGVYQCTAREGQEYVSGDNFSMIGKYIIYPACVGKI